MLASFKGMRRFLGEHGMVYARARVCVCVGGLRDGKVYVCVTSTHTAAMYGLPGCSSGCLHTHTAVHPYTPHICGCTYPRLQSSMRLHTSAAADTHPASPPATATQVSGCMRVWMLSVVARVCLGLTKQMCTVLPVLPGAPMRLWWPAPYGYARDITALSHKSSNPANTVDDILGLVGVTTE